GKRRNDKSASNEVITSLPISSCGQARNHQRHQRGYPRGIPTRREVGKAQKSPPASPARETGRILFRGDSIPRVASAMPRQRDRDQPPAPILVTSSMARTARARIKTMMANG